MWLRMDSDERIKFSTFRSGRFWAFEFFLDGRFWARSSLAIFLAPLDPCETCCRSLLFCRQRGTRLYERPIQTVVPTQGRFHSSPAQGWGSAPPLYDGAGLHFAARILHLGSAHLFQLKWGGHRPITFPSVHGTAEKSVLSCSGRCVRSGMLWYCIAVQLSQCQI